MSRLHLLRTENYASAGPDPGPTMSLSQTSTVGSLVRRPWRLSRSRSLAESTRGMSSICPSSGRAATARPLSLVTSAPATRRPHPGDGLFRALVAGWASWSAIEARVPANAIRLRSAATRRACATLRDGALTVGKMRAVARRRDRGRACTRRGDALERTDDNLAALCAHGAVRLDRECRPRLAARERRASACRQRLRRRASAQRPANLGVHLGLVEVAGPRAGGDGAASRIPWRCHRSAVGTLSTDELAASRSAIVRRARHYRRARLRPRPALAESRRPARGWTSLAPSRIEARLARLAGLFVAGSGFRAMGVPDCVADGRAAATAAARCVKMQE